MGECESCGAFTGTQAVVTYEAVDHVYQHQVSLCARCAKRFAIVACGMDTTVYLVRYPQEDTQ